MKKEKMNGKSRSKESSEGKRKARDNAEFIMHNSQLSHPDGSVISHPSSVIPQVENVKKVKKTTEGMTRKIRIGEVSDSDRRHQTYGRMRSNTRKKWAKHTAPRLQILGRNAAVSLSLAASGAADSKHRIMTTTRAMKSSNLYMAL